MKTIKNSKDITTLEVGDKVMFGNLVYKVRQNIATDGYYLHLCDDDTPNEVIFKYLKLNKKTFIKSIGINACIHTDFPETKSLVALTAIVSALLIEYEKQNNLPKTWDEFCERNPVKRGECFVTNSSAIQTLPEEVSRDASCDKNICVSKQEAEAFLALIQLRQLRKAYVKDWEPDWKDKSMKFCIFVDANTIRVTDYYFSSRSLSFPTQKLAEQFLTNFKDLLEIAKPLL